MSNADESLAELDARLRAIQELLEETLTDPSKPQVEVYREVGRSVHDIAPWATAYNDALERWQASRTTLFEWIASATDILSSVREELAGLSISVSRIAESSTHRSTTATPLWFANVLLLLILWRSW